MVGDFAVLILANGVALSIFLNPVQARLLILATHFTMYDRCCLYTIILRFVHIVRDTAGRLRNRYLFKLYCKHVY